MHQALSILTIVLAIALPAFDLAVVRPRRQLPREGFERLVYSIFLAALGLMALSSILPLAFGSHMGGWLLILHMTIAPLFAIAIALLALLWADRPSIVLWVVLAAAFVTIVSALFCMMTWFGSDWQRTLLDTHRISAMVLVVAAAVQAARAYLVTGAAGRAHGDAAGARD